MKYIYYLLKNSAVLAMFLLVTASITAVEAQWKNISGPEGGRIISLYEFNSNFYALTPNGLYKSTDTARTWQDAKLKIYVDYNSRPSMRISSSGTRLYVSIGTSLFISEDNGNSWSQKSSGYASNFLVAEDSVVVSVSSEYGTSMNIVQSNSYGNTWSKITIPLQYKYEPTGLAINSTSVLMATGKHGILRSTDHAKTWTNLNNNLSTEPLASLTADGSIYYCGTTYGKVFKSVDNGDTWQEIAATSTKFPVSSILAHGSILYFSTMGGGLFGSTDNGLSWKQYPTGSLNDKIYSIVGKAPNLIAYTDPGAGVYRSTTSGEAWELSSKGINSNVILSIFTEANTLYARTWTNGYFKSSDKGKTWDPIFTTLPTGANASCYCRRGTTLFVGTETKGVFRSRDNGVHWENVNSGIVDLTISAITLYNTQLCIVTSEGKLYVSTNDGDTWTDSSPGMDGLTGMIFMHENILLAHPFISLNGGNSWQYDSLSNKTNFIVEYDSILYAGTENGLYSSENFGISWKLLGFKGNTISSFTKSATSMYTTLYNQVHISIDDGLSWQSLSLEVINFTMYGMAVLGETIFAASPSGLYTIIDTTFQSRNWFPSKIANEFVRSITTIDTMIFAGIEEKGVLRSRSFARQWDPVNTGLDNLFVKKLVSHGTLLVAGTTGGVYTSTDNGEHWKTVSSFLSNKNILSLAWKGTFLFAGSSIGGMYRSSDSGATWAQVYTGSPTNSIWTISSIGSKLFAGTNSGILRSMDNGDHWETIQIRQTPTVVYGLFIDTTVMLAGTDFNGIYKSTDDGATWTESNTGLTIKQVWTFTATKNAIFAGTIGGVFSSTDNGNTWKDFGLKGLYITALHATPTAIYAGSPGSGSINNTSIWRALLTPPTTVDEMPTTSQELSGLHCYPNPATTSLTIDYGSLPFSLTFPIECTITTVTGEVLRKYELIEKSTTLPLHEYASGVYMITLRQGLLRSTALFSILH